MTSVFLVPAQWQLLCEDASLASRDLSALKTMSWGAAPATTTLLTRMADAFPGVTNVAVFGQTEMSPVTCALSGEDAVAVLAPDAVLTLDELREWGTGRLARYKLPTVLHIVDGLPRNASGKVMKTALRREYR